MTPSSSFFPFPRCWEIPELSQINRLPARSFHFPFPDERSAATRDPAKSKWVRSLDGDWDFDYFTSPEQVTPEDLTRAPKGQRTVKVPGNWTRQGYDKPHYTNVIMPFDNRPPLVPAENPTGVYRRTISLPRSWAGRRCLLHLGGVESVCAVYLDGQFVGWSSDSRLPAEFDLTSWLTPGAEQVLAVLVIRYSAFSYVEDQDQWWMAGLHRSVKLISTDTAWLEDIFPKTGFDLDSGTGELDLVVRLGFSGPPGRRCQVEARLESPDGKPVWRRPKRVEVDGTDYRQDGFTAHIKEKLRNCRAWSAELPQLYHLFISLRDAESGKCLESTCLRIGFRSMVVRNGQLLFNGKPILLKGVNRHDHDPVHGKAVEAKWLRRDAELLKTHNFNAVRTSHYPNDPAWLDTCDEVGLYVIGEANQEGHANYPLLGHQPRWRDTFVERASRMVMRDRFHACVYAWSLGNETGYGLNHDLAADAVRALDPSRLLHNEPADRRSWLQNGNVYFPGGERSHDFRAPMYPPVADFIRYGRNPTDSRPFIPCEYSHAMGNSNGCLKEVWDAIYRYPVLQGGFIWDWVEQGLLETGPDGKPYWAYGGDYGDEPNDVNFNCNGLVQPDRIPKPAMAECKKIFQPVQLGGFNRGTGEVVLHNRDFFRNADWLEWSWRIECNGRVLHKAKVGCLDLPPQEKRSLLLQLPAVSARPGEEILIRFSGSASGREYCWEQFPLTARAPRRSRKTEPASTPLWDAEGIPLPVPGSEALVLQRPEMQILRGFIDNEGVKGRKNHWTDPRRPLGRWHLAGLDQLQAAPPRLRKTAAGLRIQQQFHCPKRQRALAHVLEISDAGGGWIRWDNQFTIHPSLPDLPRLGIRLELAADCQDLEWFGRGPGESYSDRKAGAWIGRFRGKVSEQLFPYIVPQESGNHEDLRWICVRTASGAGVMACARQPFAGSVLPYRPEDLIGAQHPYDLPPTQRVFLNLDVAQRGLGSASCGPDTLEKYLIRPGEYRFSWWFRLLAPGEDPAKLYGCLPS